MCEICNACFPYSFDGRDGDGAPDATSPGTGAAPVGPLSQGDLAARLATLVDTRASWDLVQHTSGQAPRVLTYRFETAAPPDNPWTDVSGFVAYTEPQKQVVREILAEYSRYINVTFVEMTGAGDPNISLLRATSLYNPDNGSGSGRGRWRATLSPSDWDGAIVIRDTVDMTAANRRALLVHEIGHALGLRHPGPYDVNREVSRSR